MKLQHATWPQVEGYFQTHDTVIIGTGSCENHGTHMPLGTDALIPQRIIDLVEEQTNLLCAPMLPFGSCDYFTGYPGSISLGSELLRQVILKIAEALFAAGARRFIFINGHGGNTPAIEDVCYHLSKQGALSAIFNWWSMAGEFDPAWAGGHGGGEETAAILAIDPSLVDKDAMKPGDIADVTDEIKATSLKMTTFKGVQVIVPREARGICQNGWVGPDDIFSATPEWGEAMLTTIARYITEFVAEFQKAELPG